MAIQITGSTASGYNNTSGGTYTLAHTHPNTGTNQGLIVIVQVSGTDTNPTGVTWNGTSMSMIKDFNGIVVSGVTYWYLAAPTTGVYNVVVSHTENRQANVQVISLQNIVQSSPLDGTGTNNAGTASTKSISITTGIDNSFVLSSLIRNGSGVSQTPTYGATQTAINNSISPLPDSLYTSGSIKVTAGSETHSYTWSSASGIDLSIIALKSIATSGGSFNAFPLIHMMGVGVIY